MSLIKKAWSRLNRDDSDSSDSSDDEPEPQTHDSSDDDTSSDEEPAADHSDSSDSDSEDEPKTSTNTSSHRDDTPPASRAKQLMDHANEAADAYSKGKEFGEGVQTRAEELGEAYEAGRSSSYNNEDEDDE
jgi:hypothetical protein